MDWIKVANVSDINPNGGACVKVGEEQIAIFNDEHSKAWYALQNMCPHKKAMVLSRGMIGDEKGEPKVACPLHKNCFSLKTGEHLGGDPSYQLTTYPIKVEDESVWVQI